MSLNQTIIPSPAITATCGVHEAICWLAGIPVDEPIDPFAAPVAVSHGSARAFIANFTAMEALVKARGRLVPAPAEWAAILARTRFASPATLWTDADLWKERITSMRSLCKNHGKTAASFIAAWKPMLPMALDFVANLRSRNDALIAAGEALRAACLRGAVHAFGRDERTGRYNDIDRAVWADPLVVWRYDDAHLRSQDRLRFVDDLGRFSCLRFSRSEIEGALQRSRPAGRAEVGQPKRDAAKASLRRLFPHREPTGGKLLENAVIDDVRATNRFVISERLVRQALAELRVEGHWQKA